MAYIGIDLGSTNTCAAISLGSSVRMIELNASGATSMPSVVCIVGDQALVGQEAVEAGKQNPDFDFRNFKRMMGEKWHADEDTGYQTGEGEGGIIAYRGPGGLMYPPRELSSFLLMDIIGAANEYLAPHDSVTGVVIGVPATFTPDQINEVKRAGNMAGIENVFTIEEPVAAAIANNIDAKKTRCSIVVDLGGGTLDVTILRSGEGLIRVISKNGIGDLGGADFDKRIAEYVINLFRAENRKEEGEESADIVLRDNAMTKILVEAEAVKKRLTDAEETTFRIENISRTKQGTSLHMIYPIDRRVLNELTRDLQERVISACKAALEDAKRQDPKFTIRDIQDVLLVGGMTRMPAIRTLVTEFFGKQAKKDENPEQVVAMGCAIKAAILEGRRPDVTIQDVLTFDVAIETTANVPATIIKRGTSFPLKEPLAIRIGTADDDQTEMSVRLMYVTRPRAEDCHILEARDIPVEPGPAGSKPAVLYVTVDSEGHPSIVEVEA